jgi:hypothetical protein
MTAMVEHCNVGVGCSGGPLCFCECIVCDPLQERKEERIAEDDDDL